MNFEKIKEFILEKKVYLIIAVLVMVVGICFKKENNQTTNSEIKNTEILQSSSSSAVSSANISSSNSSVSKTVTCDITGAVKHQGVYTLKNGARLQELIEAAGGTTSRAQLKAINRAILLKDQDKIHIPYKGEKIDNAVTNAATSSSPEASSSSGQTESGDKINLNTATVTELQKLTGIGEKKAEQIIAYREQNGSFKKIEDLMQVSGIGEKTFESLKDQLAI